MQIKKLTLKNFKGIKNFELDTKGKSVDVYGDNSTGKSTLFDAVTWLLFNKDSLNSANFDIKTLKTDGQTIHNLEHEVEGIFGINGTEMSLRKVYYEKYTKKRGAASREFTGHNTDHFIDGVPVTMTEYKNQIKDICDETIFKLLSNPRYFNEVLHWQDRRKMLLEVCGDISDEDVIDSNPELADLPNILLKRKLEDHRKVIVSRRSEINKELVKIPVRIDEISSSAVEVRDKSEVEKDLSAAREENFTAQEVLKEIESGGESEVLTTKLRKIENQIQDIDNKEAATSLKARLARDDERRKLWKAVEGIIYSIELIEKDQVERLKNIEKVEGRIKLYKTQTEQLRKDWHDEDAKTFKFKQSSTCPSCGQNLPEEKIESARTHALEAFNKLKADELSSISSKGKAISGSIESEKNDHKVINDQIMDFNETLNGLKQKLPEAEKAQKDFDEQSEAAPPDNPERIALFKEKDRLEDTIRIKKDTVDHESIKEGEAQIKACDIRIESYEKELMQIDANKRIDVRVKELSDQESNLSAEFEELERQLHLADQFVRTKVSMLEESINSRFKLANFKLFEEQINQGLSETCVVTSNGVPYPSLNSGMRLNCGIDICNTLSKHFDKSIPMFLDNSESVTGILPSKNQQVRLVVSKKDKELRIENG